MYRGDNNQIYVNFKKIFKKLLLYILIYINMNIIIIFASAISFCN